MPLTMQQNSCPRAPLPMTEAEWQARVQLAACYRVFDLLGWTEMIFNHVTLRVPGPERVFLINPFGLMYHEVTADDPLPEEALASWTVAPDSFAAHLDALEHAGFTGMSVSRWLEARETIATGARPVVLTFDDGFKSNYLVAEKVLKRRGIEAVFFVSPDFINCSTHFMNKKTTAEIQQLFFHLFHQC